MIFGQRKILDCWIQAALPAIIAGAAGTTNTVLGSLLGGSSGGHGYDAEAANYQAILKRESAKQEAREIPFAMVEGARLAGIHPLVAMGLQPQGFSGNAVYGGDKSQSSLPDLREIGQDISRAVEAYLNRDDIKKKRELERRLAEAEVGIKEAQRKKMEDELSDNGGNGNVVASGHSVIPGQNSPSVNIQPDVSVGFGDAGHTPAVNAMKNYRIDENGWVYSLLDQNVGDSFDADAPNKLRYNVNEGVSWFKSSNKKRKPKISGIPPNKMLVYSGLRNQWRIVDRPKVHKKSRSSYKWGRVKKQYRKRSTGGGGSW